MMVEPPTDWTSVTGIFVGGCIARGEGSRFRAQAHAHNQAGSYHFGWICVLSAKRLGVTAPASSDIWDRVIERPSSLLWHEYAHILTPGRGHDDKWRTTMRRLGQPLPARYQKKPRGRFTVLFRCRACLEANGAWKEHWQREGTLAMRCPDCHEWMRKEQP